MPPRRALAAAALLLLALLPGCGGDAEPLSAEEIGLTAVAGQSRTARSQGKVDLELRNDGAAPVVLRTLQLRSPLFEPVPPTTRVTVVAAGDLGTLFLEYGEPRCDVRSPTGGVVLVGLVTGDRVRAVPVPLADREPGLVRAHRLACAARAVAEVAELELGPDWRRVAVRGVPTLETTLRLSRRAAGAVTVTAIGSNILFTPAPARTGPVLALGADRATAQVTVAVTATRCDPHALTESKQSFTFPAFARVGDDEEAFVPLTVQGAGRQALLSLLDEVCITGRAHGSTSPGG